MHTAVCTRIQPDGRGRSPAGLGTPLGVDSVRHRTARGTSPHLALCSAHSKAPAIPVSAHLICRNSSIQIFIKVSKACYCTVTLPLLLESALWLIKKI